MKKRKYLGCELLLFKKKELHKAFEEIKELYPIDLARYLKSDLEAENHIAIIESYFKYIEEFEWSASMIKREWVPIFLEDAIKELYLVMSIGNEINTIEFNTLKRSFINLMANASYPNLWFLFFGHNIPLLLSREYVSFLELNSSYLRENSIFTYKEEHYDEFHLYNELYGSPADETGRELRELTNDMAVQILNDFKKLPNIPDILRSEHALMEEKLKKVVKQEIYFLLEYSD